MTVRSCLEKADELKATSISLPAISSGIFGFPKDKCATVMFDMVVEYLKSTPKSALREIRFTNFDDSKLWNTHRQTHTHTHTHTTHTHNTHTHTQTHTQTNTQTYTHTYIHTHTHTNTHKQTHKH